MTMLFLGMRSVMGIGGACAEGGPFVPVRPCPEGVPLLVVGGFWLGALSTAVYAWKVYAHKAPSLLAYFWPALFLSLGWNFAQFGFAPPDGSGLVWGWIVCAAVFLLMGGLPLVIVVWAKRSGGVGVLGTPMSAYWMALQAAAIALGIFGALRIFAAVTS